MALSSPPPLSVPQDSVWCSDWSLLPSDLLCSIFSSYIPLRPRLLVLALVCSRWRRAVYLTMTVFPAISRPGRFPWAPVGLLDNLTGLELSAGSPPLPWTAENCAKIRSLSIVGPGNDHLIDQFYNLTSLRVAIVAHVPSERIAQALLNNAASLQSIALEDSSEQLGDVLSKHLSQVQHLCELHLTGRSRLNSSFMASINHYIRLHGSTLTALTLPSLDERHFTPFHTPRLASLSVHSVALTSFITVWLLSQTALTSLELGILSPYRDSDVEPILTGLGSCLVSLRLPDDASARLSLLLPCTKLRSLTYEEEINDRNIQIWCALGSRLTSLSLPGSNPTWKWDSLLTSCTALTSLRVSGDSMPLDVLARWRLPRLRSIYSYMQSDAWLSQVLRAVPSLAVVSMSAFQDGQVRDPQILFASAREAEKRGMEVIKVQYAGSFRSEHSKTIRQFRWLSWEG